MKLTVKTTTETEIEINLPIYRISKGKAHAYAILSDKVMISVINADCIGHFIEYREPIIGLIENTTEITEIEFLKAYAECQSIQNKLFIQHFAKPNEFILQQAESAGETE